MKNFTLIVIALFSLSSAFAQEEDPIKILSYKKKQHLDEYMKRHHWHMVKKAQSDSIDGDYFLYKKKTFSQGNMYMAVHMNKFCHYQVFWETHHKYSPIMSYDDFMLVPTGKSRFNQSIENPLYALKTVELDDYNNDKNKNVLFGAIDKKYHPEMTFEKDPFDFHKTAGVQNIHFSNHNIEKEVKQELKANEKAEAKEAKANAVGKTLDLEIREQEATEDFLKREREKAKKKKH